MPVAPITREAVAKTWVGGGTGVFEPAQVLRMLASTGPVTIMIRGATATGSAEQDGYWRVNVSGSGPS
jgi:hypothetical protein